MDPQVVNSERAKQIEEPIVPAVQPSNRLNNITIFSMAIFVLLSLGAVAFLYYQNQQLKQMLANYQNPVPTPTVAPVYTPMQSASPSASPKVGQLPVVTSPKPGAKVTSPLTVTGTVPAGWMFEGVFPIKLVDKSGALIVQGQAKEKVAGSWQSGNPVAFTATLTFTTDAKSGTLILENDNPSGDPSKTRTFEVPVTF